MKYRVTFLVEDRVTVEVEADSEDEAQEVGMKKAAREPMPELMFFDIEAIK